MASTISGLKSRLPREMPARMDTEMFRRGLLGFRSRKLKLDDSKVMDKVGLDTRKRKNDTSEEVYLSPPEESSAQLPEKYVFLSSLEIQRGRVSQLIPLDLHCGTILTVVVFSSLVTSNLLIDCKPCFELRHMLVRTD